MGLAALKMIDNELEPILKDGDGGGDDEGGIIDKITIHNTINGWAIKILFIDDEGNQTVERFTFVAGAEPDDKVGFTAALEVIAMAMGASLDMAISVKSEGTTVEPG